MNSTRFVICIDNRDYPVSLERRKLYEVVPDGAAEQRDHIRIIDESGEDYLYPSRCFVEPDISE
jgi:hypothetical protein